MDTLLNSTETLVGYLTAQTAAQDDYYKVTSKWRGKMELKFYQLQRTVKKKEDSFASSINDITALPPHMISTYKSEAIPPPKMDKSLKPVAKIGEHLEIGSNHHQTKYESGSINEHKDG